jgi:hypothetical protein
MYGCAALDPEPINLVALAAAGTANVTTVTARALMVLARPDRIFDLNDIPLSVRFLKLVTGFSCAS